jgi:hypothetical protein
MQTILQTRSDWKLFTAIGFSASMILWIVLLGVQHQQSYKRARESKAAGLASQSVGWDPVSLWSQQRFLNLHTPQLRRASATESVPSEADRRIVRRAELAVLVDDAAIYQHAGSALAESLGGYVVRSTRVDAKEGDSTLQVRVPAEQFEAAISDLQRLALRVDTLHVEAADVTKEYVDFEANLLNLRAEEAQYLNILKHARTVEDTVRVTEKLLNVRGRIEKTQGEFEYLRNTIALSSITVEIQSDTVVRTFGVAWRPAITVRNSFQGMLQGLANFADAMVFIIFKFPVFLLWATVLGGGSVASVRLVRRFKKVWM